LSCPYPNNCMKVFFLTDSSGETEESEEPPNSTFCAGVHESSLLTNFVREADVTVIESDSGPLSPHKRPACFLLSPLASSSPKRPRTDSTKLPKLALSTNTQPKRPTSFLKTRVEGVACNNFFNKTFNLGQIPQSVTLRSSPSIVTLSSSPLVISLDESQIAQPSLDVPASDEEFGSMSSSFSGEERGNATALDAIKKNIMMLELKLRRMGEPLPGCSKSVHTIDP